ncbi:MAG: SDR family oxidoreductase [Polyangiaceae bacterium]
MNTEAPRVALVVGGSRGTGRTVALRLAREGIRTLVVGRDEERLSALVAETSASGHEVIPVRADITDRAACIAALDAAAAKHGAPSIFVHCAAALYAHQRLHFIEFEEMDRLLQTDLHSAIYLTSWVLKDMFSARGGRIVYLGSLSASHGHPGATLYVTAKAGLEGLCRGVALDYGGRGVTANTISIGMVETERLAERTRNSPEAREKLLKLTTTGKFIDQADIAELVWFLCGPFASQITGSVIQITGGTHLRTIPT